MIPLSDICASNIFYSVAWLFPFFKINLFIYLFLSLAVSGLRCCMRTFFSCGERGLLFVAAVRGLLTAKVSLVVERGL